MFTSFTLTVRKRPIYVSLAVNLNWQTFTVVFAIQDLYMPLCYGCGSNIQCKFLPAKVLTLLEDVLELKLRKLQKIILELVTTVFTLQETKGRVALEDKTVFVVTKFQTNICFR